MGAVGIKLVLRTEVQFLIFFLLFFSFDFLKRKIYILVGESDYNDFTIGSDLVSIISQLNIATTQSAISSGRVQRERERAARKKRRRFGETHAERNTAVEIEQRRSDGAVSIE